MPELDIVTMQECAESDEARVGGYNQWDLFSERQYPKCSCPAFKYKNAGYDEFGIPNPCKHIVQAQKEMCGYHQLIYGAPDIDGVCPLCGGATRYVRVAV